MSAQNGHKAIELTETLAERIETYARAEGTSPDVVIERAFNAFERASQADGGKRTGESLFDLLSRKGLLGRIKGDPDSPTDLSTNPKHMEGFGGE